MKNKLTLFCLIVLGFISAESFGQFKIVGYHPSWAGSASNIQYSKLTHINFAFALPQSDGHIKPLENTAMLQQIVSGAHAVGTKVFIAVGGYSDHGTLLGPTFEALASTASGRTNLINDALNIVLTYNLDGVDIDWEFPMQGTSSSNFDALMLQLSTELHNRGKGLSAAVNSSYYGPGISNAIFGYVDHLNIMAYDNDNEANHSSYAFAQTSLNYWLNRGLPKNKAVLGVPFYAKPSWRGFNVIVSSGGDPYSDQFGTDYYNGIPTIQSKTQLAYNTGGGIMIWELSQDAIGTYSLLSAIRAKYLALGGGVTANANPTVSLTAPYNGAVYTAPATITITANAADADGSISKVEFYNGATLLNTVTAAPYSFNWSNVAAGNYSITAKAYDNLNAVTSSGAVSVSVQTATPVSQPPVISLTSPANGTTYSAPASITISANATSASATISKVEFYFGSTLLNSDYTAPYSFVWSNVAAGTYSVYARAYDNYNAVTTTTQVTVTVQTVTTVNQAPVVSLTSPANGTSYAAPASVIISANASDADGTISKVEFYNGATLLNTDFTAPYSFTWTNVAAGSYSVYAKAYDNNNAVTATNQVGVTVGATTPNTPPSVSITSPSNGTSFTAPANISITASASDANGTVTKVDFYNGATLLASSSAAPYSYTISGAVAGTYSLKAIATDNAGASTTSSIVTVTVNNAAPAPAPAPTPTPTPTTIGINGPSCTKPGVATTFTGNPEPGFTSGSWWATGESTSTTSADSKSFVITFAQPGTQTISFGANFNTSPWYKEYTKTITVSSTCSATASARIASPRVLVSTQPFNSSTSLSVENSEIINSVSVYDILGHEVLTIENISLDKVTIESLETGMYFVRIDTENGHYNEKIIVLK
jgi:GH18 family chitinase